MMIGKDKACSSFRATKYLRAGRRARREKHIRELLSAGSLCEVGVTASANVGLR